MKKEPLKVLVIDDDPDFLMQQAAVLKGAGCQVVTAESADEGEKKIRDGGELDVLVVDLMMERNDDGFRLCYLSKKLKPERRVIMVTGVAAETGIEFDATTREERSWIKADQILAKPVRPEQLLKAVGA
jgi:CheY-like chemotaxis protein